MLIYKSLPVLIPYVCSRSWVKTKHCISSYYICWFAFMGLNKHEIYALYMLVRVYGKYKYYISELIITCLQWTGSCMRPHYAPIVVPQYYLNQHAKDL